MVRHIGFALAILAATVASAEAQQARKDGDEPKVKVGDVAPAFELLGQDGKKSSLKDLLKKQKHVAIVFHRSASW